MATGMAALLAACLPVLPVAHAGTICTIVANARSGQVLLEEGDCDRRVTPASTFKIALSLMGFDAGLLKDAHDPVLPFRQGYPDWGGEAWTQPTDPARWMRYSVVWYSQQLTPQLGADRLHDYAQAFGYGNADFSGDPGKDNGLERAWISSSLHISPREQIEFLRKLVGRQLPVSSHAVEMTRAIVETNVLPGGWAVSGKTGGAYPRRPDGSFDRAHGWGWYVGWASRGSDSLVFARLAQDEVQTPGSPGLRTRDGLLREWDALAGVATPR
ncbi:class D beta-lactamase [Microbaculum marinum]|uniref:Beta-lactamase n=2 Tax=Microbaculum marinum TaxID=1764581 RepID=A0AAW9RDB6_9HYPH